MNCKQLLFFLFLIFINACKQAENKIYNPPYLLLANNTEKATGYKVTGIKDGDTFVVLIENKEQVVRLAHIDSPEKKQPFANNAKQFASDLCFGQIVMLQHTNQYDRYKRLIAEVILPDGRNINKELVKNGLAWHFTRYSNDKDYSLLEEEARKKRVGLWAEKNPVAPWSWRKKK